MPRQRNRSPPHPPNKRQKLSALPPVPAGVREQNKLENDSTVGGANDSQLSTAMQGTAKVKHNAKNDRGNVSAVNSQHLVDTEMQPTTSENNLEGDQSNDTSNDSKDFADMGSKVGGSNTAKEPMPTCRTDPNHYTICDIKTLRLKTLHEVVLRLEKENEDPNSSPDLRKEIITILKDKARSQEEPRKEVIKEERPWNSKEIMKYLRKAPRDSSFKLSKQVEEDIHPWGNTASTAVPKCKETCTDFAFIPSPDGLLMGVYGTPTKAKILCKEGGLVSPVSSCSLKTVRERDTALLRHTSWVSRNATPFISMTTSPDEIANHKIPFQLDRQRLNAKLFSPSNLKLAIVNSNARLAAKMPIIPLLENLEHYKVPYVQRQEYYMNKYLLPFRVNQDEIVGQWKLVDMLKWAKNNGHQCAEEGDYFGVKSWFRHWFEEVGVPAFYAHEEQRKGKEVVEKGKK